jgi:hypothetical protein
MDTELFKKVRAYHEEPGTYHVCILVQSDTCNHDGCNCSSSSSCCCCSSSYPPKSLRRSGGQRWNWAASLCILWRIHHLVLKSRWPRDRNTFVNPVPFKISTKEASPELQSEMRRRPAPYCWSSKLLELSSVKFLSVRGISPTYVHTLHQAQKKSLTNTLVWTKHKRQWSGTLSCRLHHCMKTVAPKNSKVTSINKLGKIGTGFVTKHNFGSRRLKFFKTFHSKMCRDFVLHYYTMQHFVPVTSKSQMSSQNVAPYWLHIFKYRSACFIFLNCERFTLASLTGRCPSQMQVASLSTYTTCRWTFSWWLPTELCTKSPLHCNHRFRFMIPQHTIHIPFSINVVLAPMMARPGNSSSALLEHIFFIFAPKYVHFSFLCVSVRRRDYIKTVYI